jgi:hypothetical protein
MANVDIGISAKTQDTNRPSTNVVDHVTIVANSIAIQAEDKYGIPIATIEFDISNSILRAPDAIRTDYDPAQITVNYTNASETWPGAGNQTADPLFVDPASDDYRLQPLSPAIDAGDPNFALDPDGTRTDMGFFTFEQSQSTIGVDGVLVGSSAWPAEFLARLAAEGLGTGGYALDAGGSSLVPFTNVDRIRVRFSEAVNVTTGDLELAGVNVPNYAVTGVAYDAATFTAMWSLAAPIAADKLLVRVRDTVTGQAGGSLGTDYTLRFDLLPGDADGNAAVNLDDVRDVIGGGFRDTAAASYDPRLDLDGNGLVNVVDAVLARNHQGANLPPGTPNSPAASPQAAAAVLATAVDRAVGEISTQRGVERIVAKRRDRSSLAARTALVDEIVSQTPTDGGRLSASVTRSGRRSR